MFSNFKELVQQKQRGMVYMESDTETLNQTSGNNVTGNGNWELQDGQWQSNSGGSLAGDDSAGGNPFAGGGAPSGGGDTSGGNPFAGGGAPSGGGDTSGGGDYASASGFGLSDPLAPAEGYEYDLDSGGNAARTPFDPLLEVTGGSIEDIFGGGAGEGNSSTSDGGAEGGNPVAGGAPSDGSATDGGSNPIAGGELPGNLPFGDTPPSLEAGSSLPEPESGLPVPYNSDDWTADVSSLGSDAPDATGNTGEGNGNWFYGSNNTADGNGNWYFSDGNTTSGNGNWLYGGDSETSGNGNWDFGSGNTTSGNGNWNSGDDNDILGNANSPSGTDNQILGSGNTPEGSGDSLLGNRIDDSQIVSDDGSTKIGNEDWAFSTDSELTSLSLGSSAPSQAIGSDISSGVSSLLGSDSLIEDATATSGYNNPNYDFSDVSA